MHPLRGATCLSAAGLLHRITFQSTHPLRGATKRRRQQHHDPRNFNPRTPCGVRQIIVPSSFEILGFQSTHPLRGATGASTRLRKAIFISIHAPLAGCDIGVQVNTQTVEPFQSTHPLRGATCSNRRCIGCAGYFNPRTPCGVRPKPSRILSLLSRFQSTHPLRGAT